MLNNCIYTERQRFDNPKHNQEERNVLKWYYRFIIFALLAAAIALPFFTKNKQGEPMLSLPKVDDLKPGKPSGTEQTFYKWQDKDGQWHYGDTPPPGGAVVPVTVNPNANVIQSVKPPSKTSSEAPAGTPTTVPGYTPPKPGDDILTLDRAQNIIKDAHGVNSLMEQRNKQLDAATK